MYKITKLFQKNGEQCAIIQKCKHKFMAKEYEVKCVEIFQVPGTIVGPKTSSDDDPEEIDDTVENDDTAKADEEVKKRNASEISTKTI